MKEAKYEGAVQELQVQRCYLKQWVKEKHPSVIIIFEGRDAGPRGTIRAITERLSPLV